MTADRSDEIRRLRATVGDLLALSTIPAVWVGKEPSAIAVELADVLVESLGLDFAFVRLCDPVGGQSVEAMRGDSWKAFPEWLQQRVAMSGPISQSEIVIKAAGLEESSCGVVIPVGVNAERGLVAGACGRVDCPGQIDPQLLSVAANIAATAFQNAALIRELRVAQEALCAREQELSRARDELELKVEERTSELRRSEREFRDVINTIPAVVWSALPDGSNTYVNSRFVEYSGIPADQMTGTAGWQAVIHPDDLRQHRAKWQARIRTGELFEEEVRFRRADGQYRWHLQRGIALRDEAGNIVKWYGMLTDIEDRKRAEDKIRKQEDRLYDTRVKLNHASRIATVAELSASIAHELNQPLAAVFANAQAARQWLLANPPNLPETSASIDRIMRDARAADEVVQHVRALFKRQSFDKQDVKIPDVLTEAVRFVREDPKKRDVPIDFWFDEHLPTVSADLTQMQQVFINLISNAIEATGDGHIVPRVMVRASATDQNQMLIQVIDNGPGVGDEERIFDAFVTTKKNGMGIGLAISRSIVEAHGGQLWAENRPEGGAIFTVALPVGSVQSKSSSTFRNTDRSQSVGI
jgi:PAS domain S-box-containing protein